MKSINIFIALFLCIFYFTRCNFTQTEDFEISICLPQVQNEEDLTVTSFSTTGQIISQALNSKSKHVIFEMNKNLATPVLVSNKENMILYGCIYPYEKELSTDYSYSGFILYTSLLRVKEECKYEKEFLEAQEKLSLFNWPRFTEECKEFEDPFLLDKDLIVEKILANKFKKTDLKVKKK